MEYAHLPTWDLNKTDEVEPHNHLDLGDAAGDLDHDGLSIQDADSDHDGIEDGAELKYWQHRLAALHPAGAGSQHSRM